MLGLFTAIKYFHKKLICSVSPKASDKIAFQSVNPNHASERKSCPWTMPGIGRRWMIILVPQAHHLKQRFSSTHEQDTGWEPKPVSEYNEKNLFHLLGIELQLFNSLATTMTELRGAIGNFPLLLLQQPWRKWELRPRSHFCKHIAWNSYLSYNSEIVS